MCTYQGVKTTQIKTRYKQINGQGKSYSRIEVPPLYPYAAENQEKGDQYLQTLIYAHYYRKSSILKQNAFRFDANAMFTSLYSN